MSDTVPKEKVDEVLDYAESNLDFEIVYKQEGYPKKAWILPTFAAIVTFLQSIYRKVVSLFSKNADFGPSFRERFDKSFSQGLFGMVLLNDKDPLNEFGQWKTLRHETQHLVDQQNSPFGWWYISYTIFPLPVFISGRANGELRGYTQNMLCWYHIYGEIPEHVRARIAKYLSSWMYGKPFFSEKICRKVVDHVADRIIWEDWELTFDLDVNFWEILRKVV